VGDEFNMQRIEQGSKCFDLEYGYLNNNRAV
jgi:hypothetical protein